MVYRSEFMDRREAFMTTKFRHLKPPTKHHIHIIYEKAKGDYSAHYKMILALRYLGVGDEECEELLEACISKLKRNMFAIFDFADPSNPRPPTAARYRWGIDELKMIAADWLQNKIEDQIIRGSQIRMGIFPQGYGAQEETAQIGTSSSSQLKSRQSAEFLHRLAGDEPNVQLVSSQKECEQLQTELRRRDATLRNKEAEVRNLQQINSSSRHELKVLRFLVSAMVNPSQLPPDHELTCKELCPWSNSLAEAQTCSICYYNSVLPLRLSCSHSFGAICLQRWVLTQGKSTCPLCRQRMTRVELETFRSGLCR